MIKKIAAVAAIGAAALAFANVAQAEDFPATPMNHGPAMARGMGPMGDIVNLGLTPVNVLAPPALAVTGAVVGATPIGAPEPAPAPVMHKRHHRHHKAM